MGGRSAQASGRALLRRPRSEPEQGGTRLGHFNCTQRREQAVHFAGQQILAGRLLVMNFVLS